MTTRTLKEIYEADLLSRFPDHTFDETTVGSFTKVEFKDSGDVVIGSSQKLDIGDAYKEIREAVVGFVTEEPLHDNFNTVQTTDATVTTIETILLDDDSIYQIEASVLAATSDNVDFGTYKLIGTFYRTGGGSAVEIGTAVEINGESTSNPSWGGVTMGVSGNNAIITVEGRAGVDINWLADYSVIELNN